MGMLLSGSVVSGVAAVAPTTTTANSVAIDHQHHIWVVVAVATNPTAPMYVGIVWPVIMGNE